MHVLLEGSFGHVLALFIKRSVDVGDITLEFVNNKLDTFPYSYLDRSDKPKLISMKDIEDNTYIRQKAASSLLLAYILPFIFGQRLDETNDYYRHFLGMVQLVQFSFSSVADTTSIGELAQLIYSYCSKFVELYPEVTPKPKMHFILHFVQQLKEFGPLQNQNTMRFEGKHGYFKDYRWNFF